ncbi:MAG: dienelactone hydrolase family protein, partial [Rhodospirillaceae bacterium]
MSHCWNCGSTRWRACAARCIESVHARRQSNQGGGRLMGSMVEFARPDGSKCKGYLAIAGKDRPGVIVIQEWWGLNDQICGVADRFARAGY